MENEEFHSSETPYDYPFEPFHSSETPYLTIPTYQINI